MKPYLIILFLFLSLSSQSQIIKKIRQSGTDFPSTQIENHYDRSGHLIKMFRINKDFPKDSVEFQYRRGQAENEFVKEKIIDGQIKQAEISYYQDKNLIRKESYHVISPLVRLSPPYQDGRSIAHTTTTYSYDEQDSLILEIQFAHRLEDTSMITTYDRNKDTIRITTIDFQRNEKRIETNVRQKSSFYQSRISLYLPELDTGKYIVIRSKLDKKGLPKESISWSRHNMGFRGYSADKQVLNGIEGYQLIHVYKNEYDKFGNWIKQTVQVKDKEFIIEREIEYWD